MKPKELDESPTTRLFKVATVNYIFRRSAISEAEFSAAVPLLMTRLPEEERHVLLERFGNAKPKSYAAIGREVGSSAEAVSNTEYRAIRRIVRWYLEPIEVEKKERAKVAIEAGDFSNVPIETLDFLVRTYNSLKKAKVHTLADLKKCSEEEVMNFTNFGRKSLEEVNAKLEELGQPCLSHY